METGIGSPPSDNDQIPSRFPTTRNIVFFNIAIFVLCKFLILLNQRGFVNMGLEWGPATLGGQLWRMLTSIFLHVDLGHLLGNMWWLWVVGKRAELLFSRWVFISLYLATGLIGEVLSLAIHPEIFSCGASGAIFGITGVVFAALWMGRLPSSLVRFSWRLWPLMIFSVLGLYGGASSPHVDNAAHLGGFVSGVLLGILLNPRPDIQGLRFNLPEKQVLASVLLCIVLSTITLRLYYEDILPLETSRQALESGRLDEAVRTAHSVIEKRPDDAAAYLFLGEAFMRAGNYERAQAPLDRAFELDPHNYQVLRLSVEAHSRK